MSQYGLLSGGSHSKTLIKYMLSSTELNQISLINGIIDACNGTTDLSVPIYNIQIYNTKSWWWHGWLRLIDCPHSCCYNFGCSIVWTACLFTIHVSGLFNLFRTGSNIFDPCPFSYYLYLVFPFLSRQSSLVSPLVSSVLVFSFCGYFQRLLVYTYVE